MTPNLTRHVFFQKLTDKETGRFLNDVSDADFERVVTYGRLELPPNWRVAHVQDGDLSRLGKMAHIRAMPVLSGDPLRELRAYWQRQIIIDGSGYLNDDERQFLRRVWMESFGWEKDAQYGYPLAVTWDWATNIIAHLIELGLLVLTDPMSVSLYPRLRLTPKGWGLCRVSWNRYGELQTPGEVEDEQEAEEIALRAHLDAHKPAPDKEEQA